jgi:DNA-binding FadR family transcriptional regulator
MTELISDSIEPGSRARASLPVGTKLAEVIAARIEQEIVGLGWPIGRMIGSENELILRYGVSRAIFREAVRILENHAVATMKRGPGGGLIVTEPNSTAVSRAMSLYLDYRHVTSSQLFQMRQAVESVATQIAAERIDEQGSTRLRELLVRSRKAGWADAPPPDEELHVAIADLTGNSAMRLVTEAMANLTRLHAKRPSSEEQEEQIYRAHEAIVEAIVAGDGSLARQRMMRHLEATAWYYQDNPVISGQSAGPISTDDSSASV